MRTTTATVRPRYSVLDIVGLLFRELLLMILIFVVLAGLGAAAVFAISKKSYTATAAIYAGAGQEYAYSPRVGLNERGSEPLQADAVARAEGEILQSLEVKRRTVEALGANEILGPKAKGSTGARQLAALKALDQSLKVATTPTSAIISVSYETDDPNRSARILNALIDQYLAQRRTVFRDRDTGAYASQRQVFEQELGRADAAYEDFLASNDIGDFAAAKATLAATYQTTFAERLALQAQLNQANQRLATLERQIASQPAEIVLQQDLNVSAQDQITNLRTEREVLLSRYTEDAQPVREIDEKIADLQRYVAQGTSTGVREVRTGPSTVFVESEVSRIQAAADRDGLAARLAVVDRQLSDIRARQARLTELESTNATLASGRDVLTGTIKEFQQREALTQADSALVAAGADNVNVVARAEPPTRGKSLKLPLLAIAVLFAGFTALCVGLLRVFTRRGYATPASTGRTLEMPVLAVAPVKAH